MRALQQPPNAAHAERAISKPPPPSLYKVPTYSTRAGAAPRAPGGACHRGGNRAVNSQPCTGQSTSYGDVKPSYGGGRQVGQEWVRDMGTQEHHETGGGATQTAGATPRGTRASTADKEEGHSKAGQATRTAGTGNQNGADGGACAWEAATIKAMAWPASPVATGCQGNPCSTGIRWGVSPAAQMGCLRNRTGAHQGQTSREGEKHIWWMARTARGGTGHLGLTETQRGRLWAACGQRCVDSKNSQTTPATTSTSSIRQLLGATDAQTAHHATFSTAPTHQLLGSANAETEPARAPAAAADRKQRPDATCEGENR